ncbi:radical SAM family heme chaperone HemW [Candidatus Nesciobacter abundans]|uniref:Heme chaperone HemW n=1 Tax=Candidatus Nesciobacter abundans TaxID=2601668 RepID=A0A5C0UH87_9PROT|nr:radical SAM family heme chaperone HemW [Candidatus Nesciobacter abundans]QEK39077.1 radical SAM family heme chaperone HemW [Candidatus Nesciobacter abundans]
MPELDSIIDKKKLRKGVYLYIHWPFCRKKCSYCDLNSHVRDSVDQEVWIEAILSEINYWKENLPYDFVQTIFFGGGTPSLIKPKYIRKIINHIKSLWEYPDYLEITLETNPSHLETNSLKEFRDSGINRISFGVQSLNDEILESINRTHSGQEALDHIKEGLQIFNNISVDVMYGLPNQSIEVLEDTLERLISTGIHHISIYELTVQKGTLLHFQIKENHLTLPDDDKVFMFYKKIMQICKKHGFEKYEISNFAKKLVVKVCDQKVVLENNDVDRICEIDSEITKSENYNKDIKDKLFSKDKFLENINSFSGSSNESNKSFCDYRCKHNLAYWTSKPFLGIGPGACSRVEIDGKLYGLENSKIPEEWILNVQEKGSSLVDKEHINFEKDFLENIMMGLRNVDGIDLDELENRFKSKYESLFNKEKLQQLINSKYLIIFDKRMKLTESGLMRYNAVCKYLT